MDRPFVMMMDSQTFRVVSVVAHSQPEDASMHRFAGGILVFVLGVSVVAAAGDGQDQQSATPEQQYRALLREYNYSFQAYAQAFRAAETPQDRRKVAQEKYPRPEKYAAKVLELVEKNPKEPFAEEG